MFVLSAIQTLAAIFMNIFTNSNFELYNGHFVDDLFPAIKNKIAEDVSKYSDVEITNQNEEVLADSLLQKYSLDFSEIHLDQVTISTFEKDIPAEYFPFEFNVFAGKMYRKDVIIYHIPYSGDVDILKFRPNPFSLSGGSKLKIDRDEKCFLIEVINFYNDKERIKKQYEESLRYLTDRNYYNLKENCSAFSNSLRNEILNIILNRKSKVEEKKLFVSDLGFPVRSKVEKEHQPYSEPSVTKTKPTKVKNSNINYDLAISFAGEDRAVAEKIAEKLKSLGYKIFYDKYEQANLWGKDLYSHLNDVYSNKAKYCLMIISYSYAKKHWTNHERQAAQAKAFRQNEEYILPLRLDSTEIPGINITVGYVDYNQTGFDETIKLLIDKIEK